SDVVARLVAVSILPDESRNIGWSIGREIRARREQLIELALEGRWPPEHIHVSIQVVLIEEGRLPSVGLSEIPPATAVPHLARVERLRPVAIGKARTHEPLLGVEQIAIVARAFA